MRAHVVTEISCYVDNEPGMLSKMTQLFVEKQINIKGIQVYEGQLQSLIMLVVDKPEEAEALLRSLGIDLISQSDILEVEVPNRVGGLGSIATLLGTHGINIKTVYSSDGRTEMGVAYVKVDQVQEAVDIINDLSEEERSQRSIKSSPTISSRIRSERR